MIKISETEMNAHRDSGSWRSLEFVAEKIAHDVRVLSGGEFSPLLGGGTRLMLELGHRISHDMDLFITNPQYIGYITPRLNEKIEDLVSSYDEGADVLKLAFDHGEIDFIVRWPLLNLPAEKSSHTSFELEPIPEVLAKKLFYRGTVMKHRDLFDWWAVEHIKPGCVPQEEMSKLLKGKIEGISTVLDVLERSRNKRGWDDIQTPYPVEISEAIKWAKSKSAEMSRIANRVAIAAPDPSSKPSGPDL